jgi:hypothetical protein
MYCALSVLLAAAVLTACSTSNVKVTAQDVAALNGSPQQVIPLRAGFFISDEILLAGTRSPFVGGPETKQIFEQAARRMFKELVPLTASETPSDYRAKKLDVVVSVESIQPDEGAFRAFGERVARIHVVAQWKIVSADGNRVFFTKTSGQGEVKIPFRPVNAVPYWKKAFVLAFADHLKKASTEITGSGWWKDTSWRMK